VLSKALAERVVETLIGVMVAPVLGSIHLRRTVTTAT
jgi:hypothetical protein